MSIDRLGDAFWEWSLRTNPYLATFLGDHRFNDRLPAVGAAAVELQLGELKALRSQVDAAPPAGEEEAVSRDILRHLVDVEIHEREHRFHLWAVDQMMGPQVWLGELVNYHPRRNRADLRDLVTRFLSFPAYVDAYLTNLRQGIREKRTPPRIAVERVIGQLKALIATPVTDPPFGAVFDGLPADTAAEKEDLRAALKDAVIPAFGRLLEFLEKESRPASREKEVGVWAVADGEPAYAYRVRMHTTTDLTPDQLHQVGLEEMRSLLDEMKTIASRTGHSGDIPSFFAKLKADPSQTWKTREEVVAHFERVLAKASAELPKWFHLLPKTRCVVKAIEEYREKDCVAAFYYQPPEDLSRPGIFYANTYEPQSRLKLNNAALTIHEAVPGHHLQVALAVEMKGLPAWRRNASFTAFIEGWALYSEKLGVEMGLYENDLERFGMLTYQAWRAARLVVDTGLHSKRWSREQAADYFRKNLALGETEILNEVDRYIIWPGQALAYMVGRREIWRLREEAKKSLGARFDIKGFHDAVLKHAAVPLKTLEANVKRWVASVSN